MAMMDTTDSSHDKVLAVSELNRQIRGILERQFFSCWVRGEIANFSRAASGHWYFTLKDDQASVRCAMFRARNQFLERPPRDGDHVEVRAQPTLYEQRGEYQLLVESLRQSGLGSLFEAFLKLKAKLEGEGLFSPLRKRPLPAYPRRIGIVTSPQAAALRDVLATLRGRWPGCEAILYPTPVQGKDAEAGIRDALISAAHHGVCDVILLVRGGGSLEDLAAFNLESVARSIAACPIPVVSGIGHETDFTIADFVADLRAPTPTGAAQLATPALADLNRQLSHILLILRRGMARKLNESSQRMDRLRQGLTHPRDRLLLKRQELLHTVWRGRQALQWRKQQAQSRLDSVLPPWACVADAKALRISQVQELSERLQQTLKQRLLVTRERSRVLGVHLLHLNPQAVLNRGYSIVRNRSGQVVVDAGQVVRGEEVSIQLGHGGLVASITSTHPKQG